VKPAELTETICAELPSLRRSERKVAEYVLSRPEEIIRLRIVDLAEQAQVSEPTVIRFCRAIGCNGFLDFKLALAQQLIPAVPRDPWDRPVDGTVTERGLVWRTG
jgi:RpiR family carbohydrate utilization transcriptional regulator